MIKATEYKNGLVSKFECDDAADLSNKPINDSTTGVNTQFGKITMGATEFKVYKFREGKNAWVLI